MRIRWSLVSVGAILVASTFVLASGGTAQYSWSRYGYYSKPTVELAYQYAAKFVCGELEDADIPDSPVADDGEYFTSINVHNPWSEHVSFRKKIALTYPTLCSDVDSTSSATSSTQNEVECGEQEFEVPGPVSHFVWQKLGGDYALRVDCHALRREFEFEGYWPGDPEDDELIEGFLVIQADHSLDVTGVYTQKADNDETDAPTSIDVEEIRERTLPRTLVVYAPW